MLVLAYPETIVMVADEWYSPYMRYFGIGKKDYVRAGHAALVLINKATGELEYHDCGRYITPEPYARVRGKDTDHELDFPLQAKITNNRIENLEEILEFLATHPKLTHGDGKLIASVCNAIDYSKARAHINMMQQREFIRYAAFIIDACNCARFVTGALIASVTDKKIKDQLIRSKRFTPSTVGNVVIADTENQVFEISEKGVINEFRSTVWKENKKHFLDRLNNHQPNFTGTLEPKTNSLVNGNAQWLGGIAAGAWFELYATDHELQYRFKRIAPYGRLDVEGLYLLKAPGFNYEINYKFVHYSNCQFFHVQQHEKIYRFDLIEKIN